jgi:hypothetical protein
LRITSRDADWRGSHGSHRGTRIERESCGSEDHGTRIDADLTDHITKRGRGASQADGLRIPNPEPRIPKAQRRPCQRDAGVRVRVREERRRRTQAEAASPAPRSVKDPGSGVGTT